MTILQARARALVVGGFGLTLVGSLLYVAVAIHLGYISTGQSLAEDGEIILPVLIDVTALAGWWWLTRLVVTEPEQMTLVRRALYSLAVWSLLSAFLVMCEVSLGAASSIDELVITAWVIEAFGGLVVFVGFLVIAGIYTPRRELPRELPREPRPVSPFSDDDDE